MIMNEGGRQFLAMMCSGGGPPAPRSELPAGRDLTGLTADQLLAMPLEAPSPVPAPASRGGEPAPDGSNLEALTGPQLVDLIDQAAGYPSSALAADDLDGAAVDAQVATWVAQIGGTHA